MKHLRLYQLAFIILIVLTSPVLVACAATQESGAPQATVAAIPTEQTAGETVAESAPTSEAPVAANPTTEPAADETMAEFDQMFIDMMVPHHQSAIEMAQLELQQGENPELKAMAESMIQSQQAEIDQLRQWRQQWYGSSETPPMTQMPMLPGMSQMEHTGDMMTMDMTPEIERLRNAPKPVDATFIEAMMKHHQMAIEAASIAEQQASHQEIKDTARNIIQEQQGEISELSRISEELQS
ncbi:MAG: DUF305 domain-containing protein [Anaerolineae bacterium]|jgi:uncharacterized protein (DUF305 family)|nr:DUF305 domain-containing protein [Anaerolineae bacterium]GIK37074.1 MAG: hypothetical protein BroJett011_09070 [Chloroflexota bacterium]